MLIWGLGTFKSIEFNGEVLQLNVEFGLDLDVLTVFEEERHSVGKIQWERARIISADALRSGLEVRK